METPHGRYPGENGTLEKQGLYAVFFHVTILQETVEQRHDGPYGNATRAQQHRARSVLLASNARAQMTPGPRQEWVFSRHAA